MTGIISAGVEAPRGELTLVRVFNAPRELVYKAWTDPKHLAQWWGPSMFTNPICEVDPRPGGALFIVMRAPDGMEHHVSGVFQEVVAPELLVFTNNALDSAGKHLLEGQTKVHFEDHGDKTKLTLETSVVGLVEIAAQMIKGMEAGWSQSLARLEEYVENTAEGIDATISEETNGEYIIGDNTANREIVTTRVFDAPRSLVFEAWTNPEHLVHWWGPNGFTLTMEEMDVRPGGAWRFIMHGPDGKDYRNESVFVEVIKPEKIVYDHFSPRFLATATFEDQGEQTRLTLQMVFRTEQERELVVEKFGAIEGAKQTFQRLAEHLAKM